MAHIFTLASLQWGSAFFLNAALIVLMLYRKNYRAFPFFFLFLLLDFLHGIVIFESYRIWGFNSLVSFKIAWGTRSLVIIAKTLAVAEICWRVLAQYRGIWALGKQILLAMAALVLVCSWALGQHRWFLFAINADRGLHLATAAAILTLFLFMGYYKAPIESAPRLLAIGLFLYSCFNALNNTVFERWLTRYTTLWNLLGTIIFVASLLLWTWALRHTQPATTPTLELLPEDHYRSLSPEINARLKALNDHLSYFWNAEGKRT